MSNHDWEWLGVLCQDFDRARALTVLLMVRYGEWDQLVNLRCYPSDYCTTHIDRGVFSTTHGLFQTIDDFRFDYQISELLRKCADLPLRDTDPEAAAKQAFWEAEYQCASTNIRLNQLIRERSGDPFNWGHRQHSGWQEVITIWRRICREILGKLPESLEPKFSSGSTFDDRLYVLPQDKMSSRPTCTINAYPVINPFWEKSLWSRGLCSTYPNRSSPRFVRGDRFVTVPKDATKHRGICVSPSLNVTYQLSVGKFIRERLSMQAIDLTYGQSVHQRLAEQASSTLALATIDLSSASDTVSKSLVQLILPTQWFELLDSLRCEETRIDGEWRKLEKFSAMGNGYTFELETLLFYSLGAAVAEYLRVNLNTLKVYGDDIIIDSCVAKPMVTALKFFGFIPNLRKTFIDDTPFRESCGGDYYRGVNVRGYYLENLPQEPIDYIKLANGIRRMANPDLDAYGDMYRYKRSWLRVISRIPEINRKCRGPAYMGDICLHDNRESWNIKFKRGRKYISTIQAEFDDSATTSYDRKFWTRDSIVAAATLGLLHDQGDSHVQRSNGTWKVIPGKQKIARCEPIGHSMKDIPFSDVPPTCNPAFERRLLNRIRGSKQEFTVTVPSSSITEYWVRWLLTP